MGNKESKVERKPWYTCIHTSLESPRTRILVNPFSSAYFNPRIMARYSAALHVAMPKPSRNLQLYKWER